MPPEWLTQSNVEGIAVRYATFNMKMQTNDISEEKWKDYLIIIMIGSELRSIDF